MTRADRTRLAAIRALGFATYHKAGEAYPFAFTDADGDTLYFADTVTALATAQETALASSVARTLTR